jgi:hypothetical protein
VEVALNKANPDGKDLGGVCATSFRPLMRRSVALLVEAKLCFSFSAVGAAKQMAAKPMTTARGIEERIFR